MRNNRLFTALYFLVFLFDRRMREQKRERTGRLLLRKPHSHPACFALALLAFSCACGNREAVKSLGIKKSTKKFSFRALDSVPSRGTDRKTGAAAPRLVFKHQRRFGRLRWSILTMNWIIFKSTITSISYYQPRKPPLDTTDKALIMTNFIVATTVTQLSKAICTWISRDKLTRLYTTQQSKRQTPRHITKAV